MSTNAISGGNQSQADYLSVASQISTDSQAAMRQLNAENKADTLMTAQLAAEQARTEALAKNLKKGAEAMKNII